nr:MAG TPA: holin [Caudoviricetes sp.]
MIELATVGSVVAAVNLAKQAGLPKALNGVLAIILGIAFTLLVEGVDNVSSSIAKGIVLGLGASGAHDLATKKPDNIGA